MNIDDTRFDAFLTEFHELKEMLLPENHVMASKVKDFTNDTVSDWTHDFFYENLVREHINVCCHSVTSFVVSSGILGGSSIMFVYVTQLPVIIVSYIAFTGIHGIVKRCIKR